MQPSGDMQAMRRPVVPLALAVGTYVVIAVLAYWPVMPFDASKLPHVLGAGSGDPAQMSWFLAWTPFALGHGLNPFFTNYIDYPLGVNLASNTSVPLLGLLAAPVTLALGPIASFNLLMRIALAGSATSMFLVSRRWVRWWPAAFAAGLLYGFGSYMTFEASVHLDLAFMAVPPLLLWCLDELFVTRRRSSINVGVLLGVLSAAQLLIDPEILAYCAIMAALGLVFLAIAHRREVVARVRMATPGLLAACACFALIAGYPIGYFLTGPRRIAGGIQPAGAIAAFHVDLLRPVLRASPQLVNSSGYLGVPLLIGLVALAVWWRKLGIFRFSVACACAAFVLSPRSASHRRRAHLSGLAPRGGLRARSGPRRPGAGQDHWHRDALSGGRPRGRPRPHEDLDPRAPSNSSRVLWTSCRVSGTASRVPDAIGLGPGYPCPARLAGGGLCPAPGPVARWSKSRIWPRHSSLRRSLARFRAAASCWRFPTLARQRRAHGVAGSGRDELPARGRLCPCPRPRGSRQLLHRSRPRPEQAVASPCRVPGRFRRVVGERLSLPRGCRSRVPR